VATGGRQTRPRAPDSPGWFDCLAAAVVLLLIVA
jgi:hypothetical protein